MQSRVFPWCSCKDASSMKFQSRYSFIKPCQRRRTIKNRRETPITNRRKRESSVSNFLARRKNKDATFKHRNRGETQGEDVRAVDTEFSGFLYVVARIIWACTMIIGLESSRTDENKRWRKMKNEENPSGSEITIRLENEFRLKDVDVDFVGLSRLLGDIIFLGSLLFTSAVTFLFLRLYSSSFFIFYFFLWKVVLLTFLLTPSLLELFNGHKYCYANFLLLS